MACQSFEKCGDPKRSKGTAELVDAIGKEVPVVHRGAHDGSDINNNLSRLLDALSKLAALATPTVSEQDKKAELMKRDLRAMEKNADDGLVFLSLFYFNWEFF